MKISRRPLADGLRQKLHQKSCRTCSTIVFPHSTNQIINLWRCRGRCCRHFLNSLSYRVIAVKSHRFTRAKLKKYKCNWSLVLELFISYSLHIWCFAGSFSELDCEFRASFSPKQAAAVSQFSSFLWKLLEQQLKRIVFLFNCVLPSKEDDIIRFASAVSKAHYQNINQRFSFKLLVVNCRSLHSCHPNSGESSCTTFV